ncbi:hypothetical protein JW711_01970 [Candidatus Woesearchaeota archaeon]|nr:hypothetical protein [Candidatus Woesearchaeota archaeon]
MEKKRGRPAGSRIRQQLIEILYICKKAYGYELYKHFINIYPKATMRVVYYHLKKGVAMDEFEVEEIKKEEGDYSWGSHAEKIYYKLGNQARPKGDQKVEEYFSKSRK